MKCFQFWPEEFNRETKIARKNMQTNDERKTIEKYDLSNNFRMLVAVQNVQPNSFEWSSLYALHILKNERKQ